jgi:hypothetical protein
VPYQSPTRFQGQLGSTSLDSFLRGSAIQQVDGSAGNQSLFYSPTGTVSKMSGRQANVPVPGGLRVDDGAAQIRVDTQARTVDMAEVVQPQVAGPEPASAVKDWRMWDPVGSQPGSRPSTRMWNALSPGAAKPPTAQRPSQQAETATADRDDRQVQESPALRRFRATPNAPTPGTGDSDLGVAGTGQLFERLDSLGEEPTERGYLGSSSASRVVPPSEQPLGVAPVDSPWTSVDAGLPNSQAQVRTGEASRKSLTVGDLKAAINRRTDLPDVRGRDRRDNKFLPRDPERAMGDPAQRGMLPALRRVEEVARRFDTPSDLVGPPLNDRRGASDRAQRSIAEQTNVDPGSGSRIRTAPVDPTRYEGSDELIGDRLLREYREQRTASAGAFERHMQTAREYMQQGRYYRAAESFTRASVYRPGDALPQLGKSLALFAAGEYVSSSLLLARAIELNPQCAVAEANVVNAAGGPAAFEYRLADLEQCLERSDAPQLQFLLAYVYHQIGRSQEAAQAAAAAQKGMPASMVVDVLKAAVTP